MNNKKLLAQIRNRRLPTKTFRKNADQLSLLLAKKTWAKIPKQKVSQVVLVMILRSSVAMLPAFLQYFPKAPVGFIGLKRDEQTAIAKKYYENIPKLNKNSLVIIPDPMLATGGSFEKAARILIKSNARPENIYFTGFVGARRGYELAAKIIPEKNITLLALDPKLDKKKFIVPGLGDFGDRYFGL